MNEPVIMICERATVPLHPGIPKGGGMATCKDCGELVSLTPASQKVADEKQPQFLCKDCALDQGLLDDGELLTQAIRNLSDDQVKELVAAIKKGKQP